MIVCILNDVKSVLNRLWAFNTCLQLLLLLSPFCRWSDWTAECFSLCVAPNLVMELGLHHPGEGCSTPFFWEGIEPRDRRTSLGGARATSAVTMAPRHLPDGQDLTKDRRKVAPSASFFISCWDSFKRQRRGSYFTLHGLVMDLSCRDGTKCSSFPLLTASRQNAVFCVVSDNSPKLLTSKEVNFSSAITLHWVLFHVLYMYELNEYS